MKFLGKAQKGEELPSSLQFLGHLPDVPPELMSAVKFDMSTLMAAFQLNALRSVLHVASELQTAQKKVNYETAWNNNLQGLVEAAKMYSVYLVAKFFVSALSASQWESRAKAVLTQVCEFYLVNNILDHSGTFLQNDVLNPSQASLLRTRRIELLAELRPNAVALVDAFDYPDRLLNSCLGRYDGNVYEALYEYAKSSSLNQHQVHPSFHKYVKPMRETLKSQL
ncbi:ACOX1 [Bugula neritina]|uniref:ACOX1 n=1 Tax=Bugula neritina TaxID=10212 RepID=A0A7J7J328_BUGNE|nr:ACOX1 [Bugula neritina]